jgi:NADH-quinone oxidoreductase subunit H
MRFALLQMAEYVNMITVAAVGTSLFLGGWLSPIGALPDHPAWFFAKFALALFFFIWLRGTVPRFRYDQLMDFGWKVLVPVAMVSIMLTAGVVVFFP